MSLAVYSVVTYVLFSFLTTLTTFEKLWNWWSQHLLKVFDTHHGNDSFLFSGYSILFFITGVMVTKIAGDFSIYHEKRPWQFNHRYPSLMLSVIFVIVFWTTFNFNSGDGVLNPFDFLLVNLWLLIGFAFLPLTHTVQNVIISRNANASIDENDLHSSTKHVAFEIERTLSTINTDRKSKRIAVLGKFGVGKTTAINLAVNKLKNKEGLPKLIHCNIDLWGVEAESIIQYVLDEVLIALGKEIDMCKFRSLPSHYISAMNAGNTSSKVFAAFMHKPTSPDALLKNLSDVISAANLRLLVTVQDLDRNQKALDSLHTLAGLLDRLEKLKGIDYIFAGENTPQFSDTLLRICPIRFDFSVPNLTDDVIKLVSKLIDEELQKYYENVLLDIELKKCPELVNMLLPSFRDFQSLSSQIESSWKNIKGEVLLYDFILIQALKNNQPKLYDIFYQILLGNISTKDLRVNAFINEYFNDCTPQLEVIIEKIFIHFDLIELDGIPDADNERLGKIISLKNVTYHPLSVNNERIYSILFSDYLDINAFMQTQVYETLNKVVQGDEDGLNVLCSGFKDANKRELWVNSLKSYGWAMLHNQIEDINIAKYIIHSAIKLDEKEASLALLDNLKIRKDMSMNPKSALKNYLFSEEAIEDLVGLRQHLNHDIFFILCSIYMNFRYMRRFKNNESAEVGKYLNLIVKGFINSDPQGHTVLLIFCYGGAREVLCMLDESTLNLLLKLFKSLEFKEVCDEYTDAMLNIYCKHGQEIDSFNDEFRKDKRNAKELIESIIKLKTPDGN